MKKFIVASFLLGSLFCTSCIDESSNEGGDSGLATSNGNATTVPTYLTEIQWTETKKDLGSIKEGQSVEVVYEFKNIGSMPLVIQNVKAACGCTIPEKPEEPVLPGKTGLIRARFNSDGRVGANHKTITVFANTAGTKEHELEFDIEVKEKSASF